MSIEQYKIISLIEKFGFSDVKGWLNPSLACALRDEAIVRLNFAHKSVSEDICVSNSYISDFGPVALEYLRSDKTQLLLNSIFGIDDYLLDENASCYTYYTDGGFVAPHKDVVAGEKVANILTYLSVTGDPSHAASGLSLNIYDSSGKKPGILIKRIQNFDGSVVIGKGANIWHGRSPLLAHERLIMINGSFYAHR